jgi:hypothetical protein
MYFLTGQVFLFQNGQRGSLLVCNWLHCWTKSLSYTNAFIQGFSNFRVFIFRDMLLEDSVQIPS